MAAPAPRPPSAVRMRGGSRPEARGCACPESSGQGAYLAHAELDADWSALWIRLRQSRLQARLCGCIGRAGRQSVSSGCRVWGRPREGGTLEPALPQPRLVWSQVLVLYKQTDFLEIQCPLLSFRWGNRLWGCTEGTPSPDFAARRVVGAPVVMEDPSSFQCIPLLAPLDHTSTSSPFPQEPPPPVPHVCRTCRGTKARCCPGPGIPVSWPARCLEKPGTASQPLNLLSRIGVWFLGRGSLPWAGVLLAGIQTSGDL